MNKVDDSAPLKKFFEVIDLFNALHLLVKPAEIGTDGELNDVLELNTNKALEHLKVQDIGELQTLVHIYCDVSKDSSVRWKFVCVTLHILLTLKEKLMNYNNENEPNPKKGGQPHVELLGVSQRKTIRTCLQFVISMGLLPSLLPGVGIALAARCANSEKKLKDEDLVAFEKYERMAAVTRGLLVCCEQPSLRSVILEQHLGDMMASLSQLSFVPLKKPSIENCTDLGDGQADEDFLMTQEVYAKLQLDRSHFKSYYLTFVTQVYQPLVIRELLLLQGTAGSKGGLKTKPPGWLKRACVQLLVQCLMRAGGVSSLVRALCDLSPLDSSDEWSKIDLVVRLITTPHTGVHEEIYFKCICGQIIDMLCLSDAPHTRLLTRVAILCIKSLSENKLEVCKRYILNVMLKPLLLSSSYTGPENEAGSKPEPAENGEVALETEDDTKVVLATEDEMTKCITNLYKCFIAPDSSLNSLAPDLLWPVAPILFRLHQKIYKSVSALKSYVQELLLGFMSGCNQDKLHKAFGAFLFGDRVEGMLEVSDRVELTFGSEGGVQLEGRRGAATEGQSSEEAGHCLLELLEQGDRVGDLTNVLFISLLLMLSDPNNAADASKSHLNVSNMELMDQDLEDIIESMMGTSKNMVTIKFLIILAGNPSIQERIQKEPGPIIRFIQYLLEREAKSLGQPETGEKPGACKVNSDSEDDLDDEDYERLYMIVMILSILTSSNCDSVRENWEAFEGLAKPLKVISDNLKDGETRELASRMYDTIATHGVINRSNQAGSARNKKSGSKKQKKSGDSAENSSKVLPVKVGELSSEVDQSTQQLPGGEKKPAVGLPPKKVAVPVKKNKNSGASNGPEAGTSGKSGGKDISPCKLALQSATESSIPSRGHALVMLARLIRQGDQEAQRNRNRILRIFQENLKHHDSYIYLSSINGLATMASVFPNTAIQTLIEEFIGVRLRPDTPNPSQLIMKIGEVLVQVTKQLGDFVPAYKSLLLNAFLNRSKDPDPLVRASALSNLAYTCEALGYRIGTTASEVLVCVRSVLQTDPSPVVRRASVMVILHLVKGLGEDTMKMLGPELLGLYRSLKLVYQQTSDEVLKLHCQLAIEELNMTTLNCLFPQRKLEKQIYVLDPPPQ